MGKYVKKGYANNKPPKEYQFKPGQSGYKPGRPKGSKSHRTILSAQLNALVTVLVNGKRVRKSKWQVMVEQQINAATGGNLKAFLAVVQLMQPYGLISEAIVGDVPRDHTKEDEAVIALLRSRFLADRPEPEHPDE